jgi:TolB protein
MFRPFRFASLLGALLLIAMQARAQLVIEITRGQAAAIPIAVVPLGWQSAAAAPLDVSQVVAADLARSGRFAPLERRDMIERPTTCADIRFGDWKSLKSDYIVVGKLQAEGADRYLIRYELYNVLNGSRVLEETVTATGKNLRWAGHRIADSIYKAITGQPGAFATRIAFVRVTGTPPAQRYELVVADSDAENQTWIFRSESPIMSPSWSPDGKSLAYVSFENKQAMLIVQNVETTERRRVSARSGLNNSPAWSPDGKVLALTLSRKDGDVDVYTLDLASQMLTRMTFDQGIDTEPTWSIDGKKLYFTSDRAGGPQIYEIEVGNPRAPRRVTFDGSYNARPRVSPDGKKLALSHRVDGSDRIAILDLATKQLMVVSNGRDDESPSFAPNGDMIMYATRTRGRSLLKVASSTGTFTGEFQLEGEVREPAWAPYPTR